MPGRRSISLVEIAMGLVILAILTSTAIPSFTGENTDSRRAAVEGVAGSLGSASAINYAVRSISVKNGISVSNCADVVKALEGSLDPEYRVDTIAIIDGTTAECIVSNGVGHTAKFVGHGIS